MVVFNVAIYFFSVSDLIKIFVFVRYDEWRWWRRPGRRIRMMVKMMPDLANRERDREKIIAHVGRRQRRWWLTWNINKYLSEKCLSFFWSRWERVSENWAQIKKQDPYLEWLINFLVHCSIVFLVDLPQTSRKLPKVISVSRGKTLYFVMSSRALLKKFR